jgi:ABC-2 type transport system permease protein
MNGRAIRALLKKDLALFRSDRFYFLITVIGLIFYIGVYFLLPRTVNEDLKLAVYAPVLPPAFGQLTGQAGTEIRLFDSVDGLKQAVQDGDYQAGIVLPADIMTTWAAGGIPRVTVYYVASSSPEVSLAITTLVKELAYAQTGQKLNFQTTEKVLGPDLMGSQIALRDRMRPLLAVFILLVEILSLASLISVEIDQGTAQAILVTPLRPRDLFLAKGILGVGLALGQSVLFMLLVGGFNHQPLLIFTTLLLGSVMVVGLGFLLASLARDVTVVTGWGILVLIILAIPGFGAAIPGLLSSWTKIIPSYYLTDAVSRVANYGEGWAQVGFDLAILAAFTTAVVALGLLALRRRYR